MRGPEERDLERRKKNSGLRNTSKIIGGKKRAICTKTKLTVRSSIKEGIIVISDTKKEKQGRGLWARICGKDSRRN